MENYEIRKEDIIKPFVGYTNYTLRNFDFLSLIINDNWEHEKKVIPRTLGLATLHYVVIPAIVIGSFIGLEKLLS